VGADTLRKLKACHFMMVPAEEFISIPSSVHSAVSSNSFSYSGTVPRLQGAVHSDAVKSSGDLIVLEVHHKRALACMCSD